MHKAFAHCMSCHLASDLGKYWIMQRKLPPLGCCTPGRARTDTGTLLGGLPLPLGYGGAEIVPHVRQFIQRFSGIGQSPNVSNQAHHSRQLDQVLSTNIEPLLH